ncbi:YbhN family protein [soil metagenome]
MKDPGGSAPAVPPAEVPPPAPVALPDDASALPERRPRVGRYVVILLLLGVAIHVLLPQFVSFGETWRVARSMHLWALAAALAAEFLSYVGSGYLMKAVARVAGERLSLVRGFLIGTASISVSTVAGGSLASSAATYRWMRGGGAPVESAFVVGWVPVLANILTVGVVALFGFLYLIFLGKLSPTMALAFGAATAILGGFCALVVWAARNPERLLRFTDRVARGWARLRRRPHDSLAARAASGRLHEIWQLLRRKGWRQPLLADSLNVGFDILCLFFVFVAAGHAINAAVLLAAYGLPRLLGKISIFGGLGVVEGSGVALFTLLGVPAGVSVVVMLVFRLISFWLPVAAGLPMAAYLEHSGR